MHRVHHADRPPLSIWTAMVVHPVEGFSVFVFFHLYGIVFPIHLFTFAVDYAERHPHSFRLLVRAPYSWPDDDPDAGREMRARLVDVMAANYRRESRAAGTPIDIAAEVVARLFFAMAEEVILLCRDDPTWDRGTLVDFLAEFIEAGMSGVRPDVWLAMERAHRVD